MVIVKEAIRSEISFLIHRMLESPMMITYIFDAIVFPHWGISCAQKWRNRNGKISIIRGVIETVGNGCHGKGWSRDSDYGRSTIVINVHGWVYLLVVYIISWRNKDSDWCTGGVKRIFLFCLN